MPDDTRPTASIEPPATAAAAPPVSGARKGVIRLGSVVEVTRGGEQPASDGPIWAAGKP